MGLAMSFETIGYRLDCWIDRVRYAARKLYKRLRSAFGAKPPPKTASELKSQDVARAALGILENKLGFIESVNKRNEYLDAFANPPKDFIGPRLPIRIARPYKYKAKAEE